MTRESLVPGAMNFRDVGGLPAAGGVTRSGVLYRSGNLAALDDAGVAALAGLGLRRIIDLRADDEVAYAPSRTDGLDVVTARVPLFPGSVTSLFTRDVSLDEMYRGLVADSAEAVVEVVRGIVVDQPVLVHCTVGKDRTGVTVAVALAAGGVRADAIVADYALTETLLPAERNREILRFLRQRHPDARNVEEVATRSPARVMAGMLAAIDEQYGSAAGYLRAHGMPDDEVAELRRVLIAPAD